jgi:carbonic anhydrase
MGGVLLLSKLFQRLFFNFSAFFSKVEPVRLLLSVALSFEMKVVSILLSFASFTAAHENCLSSVIDNEPQLLNKRSSLKEGSPSLYAGHHNPEHWGETDPLCKIDGGLEQSPIDFKRGSKYLTQKDDKEIPLISWAKYKKAKVLDIDLTTKFVNTGNTIEVILGEHVRERTTLKFPTRDDEYVLDQFHFHDPSEHTIEGKAYPLLGKVAVLGVFYQFSDSTRDDLIPQLINHLPYRGNTTIIGLDLTVMSTSSRFLDSRSF